MKPSTTDLIAALTADERLRRARAEAARLIAEGKASKPGPAILNETPATAEGDRE